MQLTDQTSVPVEIEPVAEAATEPLYAEVVIADEMAEINDELPVADCPHCQHASHQHGASHAPGRPRKPPRTMPGDVDRGDCPPARYQMNDCHRAGDPHYVAWWAQPSMGKHYSAWFVGGGAAFGGRGRCEDEGTWGLDYDGWLKPRRVWLNWTGGRHQGGEGAYRTEGRTRLLPAH